MWRRRRRRRKRRRRRRRRSRRSRRRRRRRKRKRSESGASAQISDRAHELEVIAQSADFSINMFSLRLYSVLFGPSAVAAKDVEKSPCTALHIRQVEHGIESNV